MSYVVHEILLNAHAGLNLSWVLWRFGADRPVWLRPSVTGLIDGSWLLFAAFWLAAALGSKKPSRTEAFGERLGHIIFMVVGFLLLYDPAPSYVDSLNRPFVPDRLWLGWLGAVVTLVGVLFAIWARTTIGKDWSAEIQIKVGHELIRSGPYAHIRHPIYTGILLAIAGTALAIGEWRGLVAFAIMAIGFARKAKREESFLAAQFGPAFEEHRRHTGFFLPRFS